MQQPPNDDTRDGKEPAPAWMKALRYAQGFLGLVVFALSAYLSSGAYLDVFGLGIVTAIFTWLVISYPLLRKSKWRRFHRQLVKTVLDAIMVIMYLAFWAATASQRASIGGGCDDDDDDDDKGYCKAYSKNKTFFRRGGSSTMAALAGVGALTWILFIATFVYNLIRLIKDYKTERELKKGRSADVDGEQKVDDTTGGNDLEGGYTRLQPPSAADDEVSPVQRSTRSPLHDNYPVSSIHTTPSPVGAVGLAPHGQPLHTDGSFQQQHPGGISNTGDDREVHTLHAVGAAQQPQYGQQGAYNNPPTLAAVAPSAELSSGAYSQAPTELSGDGTVMIHQAVDSNRMSETVDAVELDAGQHAQNWNPRGAELPGQ